MNDHKLTTCPRHSSQRSEPGTCEGADMLRPLGCVCNQNARDLNKNEKILDVVGGWPCCLLGSLEYGAREGTPPRALQPGRGETVRLGKGDGEKGRGQDE